MELFSPIYKYFTLVPNQKKEENTVTYQCNICKDNGRVSKNGEPITCKTYKNSTSNLFTHLRSDIPYHEEALKLIENLNSTPSSKKRKLSLFASNSPSLTETGAVKVINKYRPNSAQDLNQ